MAKFGISCSCFSLLLLLFVSNTKTETISTMVESRIQVSEGETVLENKTREARQVKRELPYLLIRPYQDQQKKVFYIENPPMAKMKNTNPSNYVTMMGNPEFYIKEGEIFSLEKMYPYFGIDMTRGYLTNVKKGSMQHFLSAKPSTPKYHYIKPVPSKYEFRFNKYNQPQPPRSYPPRPFPSDVMPSGNVLTPATYRDAYPHKPYSQKQELIFKQALIDDEKHENSNDVYIHNAEYSPLLTHKDIIFGKPIDPIIPPPNMKKEHSYYVRPNAVGPTFYHSYVPKVLDFDRGPYTDKYPVAHASSKVPYTIFRKSPQIEYFMPQDQDFVNIKIHTDMNKSVQVESNNHAQESAPAPSTKYHSTVKYTENERPVEPFFDINKHLLNLSSQAKFANTDNKQTASATTASPFIIYAEEQVQSKRPGSQKYVASSTIKPNIKPVSENLSDDFPSTTETNHIVEITKPPIIFNKNRKFRKQSSKIQSTFAPTIATEKFPIDIDHPYEESTTTNPVVCERECIKNLTRNDLEPVCGSDFKTYTNKGNLRCAQTCRRNDLTIQSYGICGKNR